MLLCLPLRAATISGGDYAGDPLIPVNGDTLSGTFTNVGEFTIGSGVTAYAAPGVPLVIYAATAAIHGTLDGSGRGQSGGNGGPASGAGLSGFGGGPANVGGGDGGAAARGGAGGGGGGSGGDGSGGAMGGSGYGSAGAMTIPISADDALIGSGGGGGGGGAVQAGGSGASGGASIYIEAASMTLTGSILAAGATASAVTEGVPVVHPAGGGGGGGGTVLLRATKVLDVFPGSFLSANGGPGGDTSFLVGIAGYPGGGGAGGRIKIFARAGPDFSVVASSEGGIAGRAIIGSLGAAAAPGNPGTISISSIAAAPSGLMATAVHVTSISWVWTPAADFGDGPTTSYYRIFPATATAPLTAPESTPLTAGTTVLGLAPNTTYYRFVTAFTDWGDSAPSNAVSTHTLANVPGAAAAAFTGMGAATLTLNWTAGAPANPDYTRYQVDRALDSGFSTGLNTGEVVALSSSPASLTPNTTYHFRIRAINADDVPSPYASAVATATLAEQPTGAGFGTVYVTSAAFQWSAAANPPDTLYEAQVSSDNFFSLTAASSTLTTSATFFSFTPGTQYFFKVRAVNRDLVPTDYTAAVSTRSGNLSDTSQPDAPGTPAGDRRFSYDGAVVFSWPAAASPVGILDYNLIVGSTPGGNDKLDISTTTLASAVTGLSSGQTYYARVRARSNAGVYSEFSGVSAGVPVFITSQAPAIPKPYNWPNPFDPTQGPTQIGVYLNEPATVVLRIYTLTGAPVREISQYVGGSGNQIVTWDGNNSSGARVSPGGYIIKVEKRYASGSEVQKLKTAVLY